MWEGVMRPRRCITCLSLSCLSRLSSIKPFSQQSYAMQASGPAPITGGCSFPLAVLTEGCHADKVMRRPGSWWRARTELRDIAAISLHFLFMFLLCCTQTTHLRTHCPLVCRLWKHSGAVDVSRCPPLAGQKYCQLQAANAGVLRLPGATSGPWDCE